MDHPIPHMVEVERNLAKSLDFPDGPQPVDTGKLKSISNLGPQPSHQVASRPREIEPEKLQLGQDWDVYIESFQEIALYSK